MRPVATLSRTDALAVSVRLRAGEVPDPTAPLGGLSIARWVLNSYAHEYLTLSDRLGLGHYADEAERRTLARQRTNARRALTRWARKVAEEPQAPTC